MPPKCQSRPTGNRAARTTNNYIEADFTAPWQHHPHEPLTAEDRADVVNAAAERGFSIATRCLRCNHWLAAPSSVRAHMGPVWPCEGGRRMIPEIPKPRKVIADNHLAMLAASGITPEYAERRGYMTCRASQHSFLTYTVKIVKPGIRFPGLLIPLLRIDGSTWGYQYRPDEPRLKGGKPA
jgi:hypothetical protein